MNKRIGGATALAAAAILVTASLSSSTAQATPVVGVVSTTLGIGAFQHLDAKTVSKHWKARIKTKGATDVYFVENRISPGGSYGWHSHPGPSIVVVKSGALTLYSGDDPTCTPEVVPAGSGFVDDGGDVHVVRNEGSVDALVYVLSIIPHGAERRIDEPSPGNCPF
jgi:quercetin dioxygenase-like cupin family protein